MRFLRGLARSLILFLLSCVVLVLVPTAGAQSESAVSLVNTAKLTITAIDVPGAAYTGATAINNDGDIVGDYGSDVGVDAGGFLYSNGTFTYFNYPGESITVPWGINDSDLISGYAGRQPVYGFLYNGSNFRTLQDGSDSATFALGINNTGTTVGGAGTIYTTKGFKSMSGKYKALDVPGQWTYVYGSGINNLGEIAGWTDSDGFSCQAKCQTFTVPGSVQTTAFGVNDGGVIVGWYSMAEGCVCAFAMKEGKYISFSYPGAVQTEASGINNSGQIVGSYQLSDYSYHGFVTSPITSADFQ